jgi:carboxypeptidase D
MFAGHIEVVPEHHGNLFFWLFKARHIANRQRTIIWFNGGPGCSSMDGAMMENGPYRVNKNGTLRLSDGSWDEFANIVYVDQPVGTGFSYIDTDSYVHEMSAVKEEMITFLTSFFEIFPELEHDDVSVDSISLSWTVETNEGSLDISRRRILRRTVDSEHRPRHRRTQQS